MGFATLDPSYEVSHKPAVKFLGCELGTILYMLIGDLDEVIYPKDQFNFFCPAIGRCQVVLAMCKVIPQLISGFQRSIYLSY